MSILVPKTDCQYSAFFHPRFCALPFQMFTCFMKTKNKGFFLLIVVLIFALEEWEFFLFLLFIFSLSWYYSKLEWNTMRWLSIKLKFYSQRSANWLNVLWVIEAAAAYKYRTADYKFSFSRLQAKLNYLLCDVSVELSKSNSRQHWNFLIHYSHFLQVNVELWHGCKLLVSLHS